MKINGIELLGRADEACPQRQRQPPRGNLKPGRLLFLPHLYKASPKMGVISISRVLTYLPTLFCSCYL